MRAAERGFCDIVRLLLRHGADPVATNRVNYSHHPAIAESTDLHGFVILENIQLFSQDARTALHLAAANGHTHVVHCLYSTRKVGIRSADKVIQKQYGTLWKIVIVISIYNFFFYFRFQYSYISLIFSEIPVAALLRG